MKWKKIIKESRDGKVFLDARFWVSGNTIEEALDYLHDRLINADAGITDGNENPNPKLVEKYNYWNDENAGDVDFSIFSDREATTNIQVKNDR